MHWMHHSSNQNKTSMPVINQQLEPDSLRNLPFDSSIKFLIVTNLLFDDFESTTKVVLIPLSNVLKWVDLLILIIVRKKGARILRFLFKLILLDLLLQCEERNYVSIVLNQQENRKCGESKLPESTNDCEREKMMEDLLMRLYWNLTVFWVKALMKLIEHPIGSFLQTH